MIVLDCSSPTIILIPSTSSFGSPIRFRRNQDFYISSYIDLNCQQSLTMQTEWTITNCTLNCFQNIIINPTIFTQSSELYIPSRTLAFGLYQLTLTVRMVAMPHLTSSAVAYVEITPSGITANPILYGTSMITRGYVQDLILDPGSYSIDLDGNTLNISVSIGSVDIKMKIIRGFIHFQGLEIRLLLSYLRSVQFSQYQWFFVAY